MQSRKSGSPRAPPSLGRFWGMVPAMQNKPSLIATIALAFALTTSSASLADHHEEGESKASTAVLTDIPLIPTPKVSYGVDDFCARCQVCVNACPPDAMLPEKVLVRGSSKWYVDFDKCIPFFNENSGCAICIAVCPWSIPGRGANIVQQLLRRVARSSSD